MIPDSDITRMQQEAVRRVNEMHNRSTRPAPPPKPPPMEAPKAEASPPPKATPAVPAVHSDDVFENLMNDKERNLILLLIVLLMGEETDHALLLALLYLAI